MEYKVFISQPMTGRTLDEVKKERHNIELIMQERDEGLSTKGMSVKVIDSFDEQAFLEGRNPLDCLGDCIKKMSEANIVVFAPGWDKSRGCRIEHHVCSRVSDFHHHAERYDSSHQVKEQ